MNAITFSHNNLFSPIQRYVENHKSFLNRIPMCNSFFLYLCNSAASSPYCSAYSLSLTFPNLHPFPSSSPFAYLLILILYPCLKSYLSFFDNIYFSLSPILSLSLSLLLYLSSPLTFSPICFFPMSHNSDRFSL